MSVSYDSANDLLVFGGDRLLDDTLSPLDTILGRGRVEINSMSVIGLRDDGSIHLADTSLQIMDVNTQDTLLKAILYGITYRPSSLPGYAGMMVAGMDIPPDFARGINNTIGSDFLLGIEQIIQAQRPVVFWYYPKSAIFHSSGAVTIPAGGVDGRLILGTPFPVPEPGSVLSLIIGIAGLLALRHRISAKDAGAEKTPFRFEVRICPGNQTYPASAFAGATARKAS
jgi:hypothetical protein